MAQREANENIEALLIINQELIELANAIPVLDKLDTLKHINQIQSKVANLAQRVIGWEQLAQAKKDVLKGE